MPRTVPVPVGGSDARLPRAPGARTARAGPRGTAPRAGRAPRRGARVQPLPTERSPVILASSLFVLCSAVSAGTIKLDRNGGVSISHATHSGAQRGAPVKGRHAWARVSARVCACMHTCVLCLHVWACLHACGCASACVCVYVCPHVCTCVYVCAVSAHVACVSRCVRVSASACACVSACVHVSAHICMCVCARECMPVHVCICTYVHACTHVPCLHVCAHVSLCVCVCLYMCVHVSARVCVHVCVGVL